MSLLWPHERPPSAEVDARALAGSSLLEGPHWRSWARPQRLDPQSWQQAQAAASNESGRQTPKVPMPRMQPGAEAVSTAWDAFAQSQGLACVHIDDAIDVGFAICS